MEHQKHSAALIRLGLMLALAALALGLMPAPTARAATIVVDTTADELDGNPGNGDCSLREAITNANNDNGNQADCDAGSGADTITLPTGTYTLAIATTYEDAAADGDLDITDDLIINGAGAGSTIIDGDAIDRVFHIHYGASVEIYDVTIQNGYRDEDACEEDGGVSGGGIHSDGGDVHLERCTIRDNHTANHDNGAGCAGGIRVWSGTMTLVDCAVLDNSTLSAGGGIKNDEGTLTLINTTVSGNSSYNGYTGGVHTGCDGTTTFDSCTIVNNTSNATGSASHAGGISGNGTVNIKNTIVANNTDGNGRNDCSGTLVSQGYNLIEDASTCTITGDTTGNITGSDPNLGPLADNGGRTWTHALLDSSPAIDQVPNGTNGCGTSITADQRGKTRPVNLGSNACDMGAFERQANDQTGCASSFSGETPINSTTNISVTVNSGDPGTVCVLKRSDWPGLGQDTGEFQIVWTINASGGPYNLDLKLCYTEAELGGSGISDENTITVYRWNEDTDTWQAQTTSRDPGSNCVTVSGVTALSPWTLAGDGNAPNAMMLHGIAARAPQAFGIAVFVGVGTIGGTAGLLLARRRRRA